jgi:hypothetical protein
MGHGVLARVRVVVLHALGAGGDEGGRADGPRGRRVGALVGDGDWNFECAVTSGRLSTFVDRNRARAGRPDFGYAGVGGPTARGH